MKTVGGMWRHSVLILGPGRVRLAGAECAAITAVFAVLVSLILSTGTALAGHREDCKNLSGAAGIEACDRAIRQRPRDGSLHFYRARKHGENGDLDQALEGYSKAIEIDPNKVGSYVNRGLIHYMRGDLDRAIADQTKAIVLSPKLFLAHYHRGQAYLAKKEYERAIVSFDKAIELNPKNVSVYLRRGFAYEEKSRAYGTAADHDRVLADYTKAIEINPDYALAYYIRAQYHGNRGDQDRAFADYVRAIALDPKLDDAYNNRGVIYQAKGDLDRALADYTKAIEMNSKSAIALHNRCALRARIDRDLPLALSDCDDAIRLAPKNERYIRSRALVYLKLNRHDEAIAEYEVALKINSQRAVSYYGRGLAKRRKGDVTGGDADIERAKAIDPDIVNVFAKLTSR